MSGLIRSACAAALLLGLAASLSSRPAAVAEDSIPWFGESRLRRATLAEARSKLGESDLFTKAMSPFDRMSRLEKGADPGDEALRTFAAAQAVEWTDSEWGLVSQAARLLHARLTELPPLPWPRDIHFFSTTGREEGEAAYCRGPAVILPRKVLGRSPEALERLLAHELFHVLSNQNLEWRRRVYAVVGFQLVPEVPLPAELEPRKITNPDGALVNAVVQLELDGGPAHVAPVLIASTPRYDPQQGGSFFRYLQFRLLVVQRHGDQWRAKLDAGRPQLLEPEKTPAYGKRIGKNTGYIIHPDEIMADNFVHLVFQTQNLPTPDVVEGLRAALQGKP